MSDVLEGVKVVELAIWVDNRGKRSVEVDLHTDGGREVMERHPHISDEFDVWWAPIQSPAEALEDPQAEAVGAIIQTEDFEGATERSVNSQIDFHGHEFTSAQPPPLLGEHPDEVLRGLGFSGDEIEAMRGSAIPDPGDP